VTIGIVSRGRRVMGASRARFRRAHRAPEWRRLQRRASKRAVRKISQGQTLSESVAIQEGRFRAGGPSPRAEASCACRQEQTPEAHDERTAVEAHSWNGMRACVDWNGQRQDRWDEMRGQAVAAWIQACSSVARRHRRVAKQHAYAKQSLDFAGYGHVLHGWVVIW
jgi:hypothetical protein